MAFIRSKTRKTWYGQVRGQTRYNIVENVRDGGKVRQKVLLYLGPCDSVEEAIVHFREQADYQDRRAFGWRLTGGCGGYLHYKVVPVESATKKTAMRQARKYRRAAVKCEKYLRKLGAKPSTRMTVCGCRDCCSVRRELKHTGSRPSSYGFAPAEHRNAARVMREIPVVPNSAEELVAQLGTT